MFACWLLYMKILLCGIKVCGEVICVFRLYELVLMFIFILLPAELICEADVGG